MADNFLMKGKVYGERKHLLNFPAWAEVKYDEIRLHVKAIRHSGFVTGVQFLSYAGKPLNNLEFWAEAFKRYLQERNLSHLDLGVLVNGNFNDSYRWTRSSTGIPKQKKDRATGKVHPALLPSMVNFYLFDIPELVDPFYIRRNTLDIEASYLWESMREHGAWPAKVFRPEGYMVQTERALELLFLEVRERGLEGLMVKDLRGEYVSGCAHRSDYWLKLKPENDADGVITGVNRAYSINGEPLDRAGSIDVRCEDGSEASPSGIAHELGADMWAHPEKYTGRWVEFKYMERDRQGGYRHPSFTRFREDKA